MFKTLTGKTILPVTTSWIMPICIARAHDHSHTAPIPLNPKSLNDWVHVPCYKILTVNLWAQYKVLGNFGQWSTTAIETCLLQGMWHYSSQFKPCSTLAKIISLILISLEEKYVQIELRGWILNPFFNFIKKLTKIFLWIIEEDLHRSLN